jgi:hypothetical protein
LGAEIKLGAEAFAMVCLPGKSLSIFSRPVDPHWNTFLDDLKPDVREQF